MLLSPSDLGDMVDQLSLSDPVHSSEVILEVTPKSLDVLGVCARDCIDKVVRVVHSLVTLVVPGSTFR